MLPAPVWHVRTGSPRTRPMLACTGRVKTNASPRCSHANSALPVTPLAHSAVPMNACMRRSRRHRHESVQRAASRAAHAGQGAGLAAAQVGACTQHNCIRMHLAQSHMRGQSMHSCTQLYTQSPALVCLQFSLTFLTQVHVHKHLFHTFTMQAALAN